MNIFDFENRLKNFTSNSKGDVDMDRLLKDLNIKPQANTSSRFAFYFFAAILAVGLSYIGYTNLLQSPIDRVSNNQEVLTPIPSVLSKDNGTQAQSNVVEVDNSISSNHSNIKEERNETISAKDDKKVKIASVRKEVNKVKTNLTEQNSSAILNTEDAYYIPKVPTKLEETKESNKNKVSKIIADTKIKEFYPNQLKAESLKKSNENLDVLPLAAFGLLDYDDGLNYKKLKREDCPRFSGNQWGLSVLPEVGYIWPRKSLELLDESFRDIFDARQADESTIEGISASLSLQFKNEVVGFYIKPGISYSRFTERLNFKTIQEQTVIESKEITVTNPDGSVTTEINIDTTITSITTTTPVQYQLNQFELPIAFGYSIDLNKLNIDVEAGVKINFLQRATGQILSAEDKFIDASNNELFKDSAGLGFFGGIQIRRKINPRTQIYIAPRYSFNTLSFSSNINPIQQKYTVFGVHAGLVYAIN